MKFWMVKQEPEKYSFYDLMAEGRTDWTGVRNFQARNNLREMRIGDKVLVYHSVSEKAVVGAAEVSREAFPDETVENGDWIAVEIKPLEKFEKAVSLDEIKHSEKLKDIALIRQSRLSVMPLSEVEYQTIVELSKS
jgi:predicted RNA-binding protein with PUA-like domain